MQKTDYFNDGDEAGEEDSLLGDAERQGEEKKSWDRFEIIRRTLEVGSTAESKWIDNGVVFLKFASIVVVFLIVLGTAVISKGTMLFMTSQIKKNITRPVCNSNFDSERQYRFTMPDIERTTWIWLLMFAYFVPEAGTFLRSLRILCFKSWKFPGFIDFLVSLITETPPAIGSALLIFVVLPEIDVIKGAMLTNAVCFVPSLAFLTRNFNYMQNERIFILILDCMSLSAQVSAFVVWPIVESNPVLWIIPIAVTFISFGWWENFIPETSPLKFLRELAKSKKEFPNDKYFSYAVISIIKCLLFFTTAMASIYIRDGDVSFMFDNFKGAFTSHAMNVTEVVPIIDGGSNAVSTGTTRTIWSDVMVQLSFWLANIASTYVCYAFGKFACKIMIQSTSFAFPISLSVPVLISSLVAMCGYYVNDQCAYSDDIPSYLFFNTPPLDYLKDFVGHQYSWVWLLWLLSQIWITRHIWSNNNSKLASTENIFMRPMYDAFLIDQSIAMNRRNVTHELIRHKETPDDVTEINEEKITKIYACATMWHETKEEMIEFLKSIMRMDEDQAAHRIVRQYLQYPVEGYYEFETHIFFDDAFVRKSTEDNDPNINEYVQKLVSMVGEAASEVHHTTVRIRPPTIYPTPYGGRLVWTLPGKTKIITHLKDKAKIRAKKRWSQVMYMYYLLGHKLIDRDDLTKESKDIISKNTYLLALDGDMDFQPTAVHLLVQYMKKNGSLGAACGRIHPVGSGAMAWYQVFEYAVGHWMQKATEHVIGCVLCSPGCFSLFRASALMDDNVMARYTTTSKEARHYVQYDQGEDRWLCTLLLQRGYRVEYSAASDSYTHCPEGFNEFYNQRRRWMPSTMANILDLLQDSKYIVKVNDDISRMYIFYQIVLLIGTVIGPGTIFLMLIGAFVTAFKLSQWAAFMYNIIPIMIFVLACIFCKSDTQLTVAGMISGFYGLVMMAVLIGILMQINQDGVMAPSSLFFFLMAGEFIVAGIIHPKEFYCLPYGVIYYVTVPSMYMLLVIYSVFNMNNVSWGTREVTVVPKNTEGQTPEQAKKAEKKEMLSVVQEWLYKIRDFFSDCCNDKTQMTWIQNSLSHIDQKLDYIERLTANPDTVEPRKTMAQKRKTTIIEGSRASRQSIHPRQSTLQVSEFSGNRIQEEDFEDFDEDSIGSPSDDLPNNSWFYDGELIRGHVTYLDNKEETFWKELIDKYLHPIEDDKAKVALDLKNLRDKMVITFFALNSLFVLVVFLLTIQKDLIHVNWPFNPKVNFTYTKTALSNDIVVAKKYLQLEPIGFVFLVFFFGLMFVQFICMFIHRFGTYSQIMANTDLDFDLFETKIENLTEDEILEKDPIKIFRKLIKLKGVNGDDRKDGKHEDHVTRRNTVARHAQNKDKKVAIINDLDTAFAARMEKIRRGGESDVHLPRSTLAAINRQRTTVLKRKSQMPQFNPNDYMQYNQNLDNSRPGSAQFNFENPAFEANPESNS